MKSYTAHEIAMMPDWSDLRLDKGLSLEKIAAATNIPERKLQALERHEFADLGPPTFALGYLRTYAKILGEDPEIFVQVYRDAVTPDAGGAAAEGAKQHANGRVRRPIWQKLSVFHLVAGAAMVWLVVIFMRDKEPVQTLAVSEQKLAATLVPMPTKMEDIVETVAPQVEDLAALAAQQASLSSELGPSASEILAAEAPVRSEPIAVAAAEIQAQALAATVSVESDDPADANSASPGLGEDVLIFSFEDDCWVEVKDADNSVLIAELKRKGDNLRLFGQGPFNILLGNARSVNLTLNGEAIKIEPIAGNRTLRFTASG